MPRNVFSRTYLLRIFISAMVSTTGLITSGLPSKLVALAQTNSANSVNTLATTQTGISGTVSDPAGNPIVGATVTATDSNGNSSTTITDSYGDYSFTQLSASTYTVSVDYQYDTGSVAGIVVTQGQMTSNENLALTATNGEISGSITDGSTTSPAVGATITVTDGSGNRVYSGRTDANGSYTLYEPAGTYAVQATFTDANGNPESAKGSSFTLSAGTNSTQNLTVKETGLTGTITDSNGKPVSGAPVVVQGTTRMSYTTTTNSQGQYSLYGLPTDTYKLSVNYEYYTGTLSNVQVSYGQVLTSQNLTLSAVNGQISGTVLDGSTGLGASFASVTVYDSTGTVIASTTTASDGTYSFYEPTGNYTVEADYTNASGYYETATSSVISVNAGVDTTQNLTVQATGIAGTVLDSTGNTVSGVEVVATDTHGTAYYATTDSSGNYSFTQIPPAIYTLTVKVNYLGASLQNVGVTQGKLNGSKNLRLSTVNGQILGTITDQSTNLPAGSASVAVYNSSGTEVDSTSSASDGTYSLYEPAGTYTVQVYYSDSNGYEESATSSAFTVTAGADITESLTVQGTGISGTVTDSSNTPLSGVQVIATDSYGTTYPATTDSSGNYTFPALPTGVYTLTVNDKYLTGELQNVTVQQEQMSTGENITLSQTNGQILGMVTDGSTGNPAASANVTVYNSSGVAVDYGQTTSTGSYSFYEPAGGYTVEADYTNSNQENETATSSSFTVTAGADSTANLTVKATGISGTVTDSSNAPLANARVTIMDKDDNTVGSATTDSSGNYTVANLLPGTYIVSVSDQYLGGILTGISVTQGQMTSSQNVSLYQVNGEVTGTLVDSTGTPLAYATVNIHNAAGENIESISADSTGVYAAYLPAGVYTLSDQGNEVSATITVGNVTTANLTVGATGVSGTVSDVNGPAANATVNLYSNGELLQSATTDANGNYSVQYLLPGTYTIQALNGFEGGSTTIHVNNGEVTTGANVAMNSNATELVKGAVTDVQGNPVTSGVQIYDTNGNWVATAQTDSSGNYSIYLPLGTYDLQASIQGSPPMTKQVVLGTGGISTTVNLVQSGIMGTVVDGAGSGVPNAEIRITTALDGLVETVLTDSRGQFAAALPSGTYSLYAGQGSSGASMSNIQVTDGQVVSGETLTVSTQDAQLSGTVTDDTGTGAPGVEVDLYNTSGQLVDSTLTDSTGNYQFSEASGSYILKATYSTGSFTATAKESITLAAGTAQTANLQVKQSGITGVVDDASGSPLAGADVQAYDLAKPWSESEVEVTTASDGSFTLNLPAGDYAIEAKSPDGVADVSYVRVDSRGYTTQKMSIPNNYGTVSGTINDINGKPVSQGTQFVVLDSSGSLVYWGKTSANGSFSISAKTGTYSVLVAVGNSIMTVGTVTLSQGTATTENLREATSGADLTIVDSTGDPVTGANVIVTDSATGQPVFDGDVTGNTVGVPLKPGTYTLQVQRQLMSQTQSITIASGLVTPVTVQLQSTNSEVTGLIQNADGSYAAGTWVQLLNSSGKIVDSTQTDSNGRYDFFATAGTYTVVGSDGSDYGTTAGITTTAGQRVNTNFQLSQHNLSVSVVDSSGNPIGGATVEVSAALNYMNFAQSQTSAAGQTSFGLVNGEYYVSVWKDGYSSGGQWLTVNSQSNTATIHLTKVAATGVIQGVVTDGSGNTVPRVNVAISDAQGDVVANTTTQADGSYTVNVPQGTYAVHFDYEPANAVLPVENSVDNVQVTSGQTINENTTMQITGISGTVTKASDNSGLADATVTLYDPATYGWLANQLKFGIDAIGNAYGLKIASTTTDAEGNYLFNAPPGTYNMIISKGFYYQWVQVTVSANGFTRAVDPTVSEEGVVTGFVTDGTMNASFGSVEAFDSNNNLVGEADVALSGAYAMHLPDGTYTLEYTGWASPASTTVTVTNGTDVNANLTTSNTVITGVVRDSSGAVVAGAEVTLYDQNGVEVDSTYSNSSGQYSMQDAAGQYELGAHKGYNGSLRHAVTLQSGQSISQDLSLSQTLGKIIGQFTDQGGQPASYREVEAFNENGAVVADVYTGYDGQYEMYVPAGTYTVSGFGASFEANQSSVAVTASADTTANLVFNQAIGRFGITVVDQSGEPVPGATVQVVSAAGTVVDSEVSGPDGMASFAEAPGTYTLIAVSGSYSAILNDVSVSQSQNESYTLALQSGSQSSLPVQASIDSPTSGTQVKGLVTVKGWALDGVGVRDVNILVDGQVVGTAQYGLARADVAAAYPQYNNAYAGYTYSLDTHNLSNGQHQVSIQVDGRDGTTQKIAGPTIDVENLATIGEMDSPAPNSSVTGNSVTVSGWVLDGTGVKQLNVVLNGQVVGQATYGDSRPDVAAAYPTYNDSFSGYHYTLDTSALQPGTINQVAIQVVRTDGTTTTLPASTFTVPALSTMASMDYPMPGAQVKGKVTVSGWALDGVGVKDVEVLVDGKVVGTAQYGLSRPDVASAFPKYNNSNSGYTYTLDTTSLTNGNHHLGLRVDRTNGTSQTFTESTVDVENLPTIGNIDSPVANAQVTGKSVTVSGWVLDQAGVKALNVLVDGQVVGQATYGGSRPDVAEVFPKYNNSNSGFAYTLDTTNLGPGIHDLSLQVVGADGSNTVLPSSTFAIPALPTMVSVDKPTPDSQVKGTVTVSGWAIDGYGVKEVDVLMDGQQVGTAQYGGARPDVGSAYPQYNNSFAGFSYSLDTKAISNGSHGLSIKVVRVNGTSQTFSEGSLDVENLATIGHMDFPAADSQVTGSTATVSGWVLDGTGVKQLNVLLNGQVVGQATYGDSRPDVNASFPKYDNGNSGYHYTLDTSNLKPGSTNQLAIQVVRTDGTTTALSGSTFTIPALPTLVSMDFPSNSAQVTGDVTVSGWALDGVGVKDVKVLVDGTVAGTTQYGGSRPDVESAYPQYGNAYAGYSYTLDTRQWVNGSHQLSIEVDRTNGTAQTFQESNVDIQNLPTVGYIDGPTENTSVTTGSVTVSGWVLDQTGVKQVNVMIDGKVVGKATYGDSRPDVAAVYPQYKNTNSGFHYILDTRNLADGTHHLALQVVRTDGTTTELAGPVIDVNILPTLAYLDTPINGATVKGAISLSGWALDGIGIKDVKILIDGKAVGTAQYGLSRPDVETAYPQYNNADSGYAYAFDTTTIANGSHTVAILVDKTNGTSQTFQEGSINVQN